MRAIRFDGARVMMEPRADPPVAGPGEAVIRGVRAGVSAFDAALDAGSPGGAPREAVTLGHEFVGVVESLGDGADRDLRKRWEGKRVTGSANIVCGRCDMCRGGLPNHCRSRRVLGVSGWDGCLAERFKLPVRNLAEVPGTVGDEQAVFAWALAGALHAANIVRLEGKPFVTVLGDGVDALLCAQVMVKLNASVRVLGSRPEKFTLCERWGIKHRHNAEAGRRHDQDIVIDCTGLPAGLTLAMQMVRPRGKIVLKGEGLSPEPGPVPARAEVDLSPLVENEIELIGARCGNVADAVARLANGEIDVLPLITKRAKLADGAAAVKAAGEADQLKVVVEI